MLQIQTRKLDELIPYSNNARKHSDKQISKIASSIRKFGFNNPILINKNNTILAGHGRWMAAKKLKMTAVPTICLDHMTEEEVRAYIIADNKLAELAGWDHDILAIEFQHLISLDVDFDVEITGFETGEIDFIIGGPVSAKPDPDDEVIDPQTEAPAITKSGDLWLLGQHRLYCGNSLEEASYSAVMGDEKAQMVFTDPPYNVLRKLLSRYIKADFPNKSTHDIDVPYVRARASKGAIVIQPESSKKDILDLPPDRLKKLIQGIIWCNEHHAGTAIKEIAAREACSESYVGTAITGSFEILQSAFPASAR